MATLLHLGRGGGRFPPLAAVGHPATAATIATAFSATREVMAAALTPTAAAPDVRATASAGFGVGWFGALATADAAAGLWTARACMAGGVAVAAAAAAAHAAFAVVGAAAERVGLDAWQGWGWGGVNREYMDVLRRVAEARAAVEAEERRVRALRALLAEASGREGGGGGGGFSHLERPHPSSVAQVPQPVEHLAMAGHV
ncbi:hypothetical protein MMPV_005682 [Pyropia vietnamensis]